MSSKQPFRQGRISREKERLPGVDVLRFYVGTDRPGLGMDAHERCYEEPQFGLLVVENARALLAQLEREIRYGAAWNRRAGEDKE